jgi:putative FmdB family regulatory protein
MPLFSFFCEECKHNAEHFQYHQDIEKELICPECSSERYKRQVSRFRLNVEYADSEEWVEKKVQPHVDEAYEAIGKEALNEDTRTLDNLFGEEKVENTFHKQSD